MKVRIVLCSHDALPPFADHETNSFLSLKKVSRVVDCSSSHCYSTSAPANANHRVPDGKVCLNDLGELAVTKFAVEPV